MNYYLLALQIWLYLTTKCSTYCPPLCNIPYVLACFQPLMNILVEWYPLKQVLIITFCMRFWPEALKCSLQVFLKCSLQNSTTKWKNWDSLRVWKVTLHSEEKLHENLQQCQDIQPQEHVLSKITPTTLVINLTHKSYLLVRFTW